MPLSHLGQACGFRLVRGILWYYVVGRVLAIKDQLSCYISCWMYPDMRFALGYTILDSGVSGSSPPTPHAVHTRSIRLFQRTIQLGPNARTSVPVHHKHD